MTGLDVLWQPVRIGPATARNRIYLPAHQVSLPPLEYGAYLGERARGGLGLVVTHGFHVMAASAKAGVSPWQADWIPAVKQMVAPVHAEGVPVFVQITHMGASGVRRTDDIELWGPLLAPSAIASSVHKQVPRPMNEADIEELIEGFVATAANVQEGGADGVELHGSHGYLLSNFLSPWWNRRDDAWGGDTERRARLAVDIGRAVRKRCGSGFVIGMKLSLDEYLGDAGTTPDEAIRTLAVLQHTGLFDYFCFSHTDYHNNHRLVPPASSGETMPLADAAGRARRSIDGATPILVQGSVRSIAAAAQIAQRGDADLVGLVRAHIADPDLVRKAREGRADQTRRCVGANQGCWRRLGQPVSCTVNPEAGRELAFGSTVARPPVAARKLLVIGGGPGGLKFADTAAALGHRVTLWERGECLGGQLRQAGQLPDHDAWNFLADDLTASLARRGVEVRLNLTATAQNIAAFGADEVVLATGARWQTDGFSTHRTDREAIPRDAAAQVLDPLTALSHPQRCGPKVVIIDDNGDYMPLGLARLLAAAGRQVTVLTADTMIGRRMESTVELPWMMPRVAEAGVAWRVSVFVERINAGSVLLRDAYGRPDEHLDADTVVLCMARRSEDGLYHALRARGLAVRRIGDCVAPREVDDAVLEGFREANAIA
jgi:2,4-dienoyl-CoA reductase-like NADH-dependent reductase (Old Yellow Enzyme family)